MSSSTSQSGASRLDQLVDVVSDFRGSGSGKMPVMRAGSVVRVTEGGVDPAQWWYGVVVEGEDKGNEG